MGFVAFFSFFLGGSATALLLCFPVIKAISGGLDKLQVYCVWIHLSQIQFQHVCRLYVNWRFLRGIEAQFLALQKGFNEVIPQHLLKTFDEKELEVSILMLCYVVKCNNKSLRQSSETKERVRLHPQCSGVLQVHCYKKYS